LREVVDVKYVTTNRKNKIFDDDDVTHILDLGSDKTDTKTSRHRNKRNKRKSETQVKCIEGKINNKIKSIIKKKNFFSRK